MKKDNSTILRICIADYETLKQIRTDPATAFTSNAFRQFCDKCFIKHIKCPVNDQKGNGKVERLIRTMNEQLRGNKNIELGKDNTGLSEMLYALRGARRLNELYPAEHHINRKFTTVKDIITTKPNKNYTVLDNDNNFQLEMSAFPGEQNSEILVRERARGTKLEGLYKKKKGTITNETAHAKMMSNKKRQLTTYSKRDIATPKEMQATTSTNKQTTRRLQFDQSPTTSAEPIKNTKLNQTAKPIKAIGSKKRSKHPKEFKRLANWEQIAQDSTDEEEESLRQNTAIKAAVTWEKPTKTEPESEEEETTSQLSADRSKRERKRPNYFGNPVMIRGVEEQPEVITLSSSTEDN